MLSILAKNLKWLREFYGFTQQHLAEACHIDRSTYAYYERGTTEPGLKTLAILGRVLKVTIDELVTLDVSACPRKKEEKQTLKSNDLFLSKSENEMLVLFRALDEDLQKEALKAMKEIIGKYHKKPSA